MAKQKPSGWLDKYASTVAASDATRVNKQLVPLNAKKVTQEELDAREVKARRDRIAVANAAKSKQLDSPEAFAQATSATADKLRLSENPNIFDDYINPATYAGHLASGLGQVPLNIQEGNYGQAALNTLSPVMAGAAETLLAPVISKGMKSGRKAIDKTFTKVGSDLARIEKEGVAKGLSPHEIKMQQMNDVGITSAQREAYVPGVSDFLYKYVKPQGYSGLDGKSKLSQTLGNIKEGGVNYSKYSNWEDFSHLEDIRAIPPPREDAWRLYLGKPQRHGTFEMAQTAPIQHPAYTPEQLSGLDLYSIKSSFGKRNLFPGYNPYTNEFNNINYNEWHNVMPYLENPINTERQNIIMGGHNKRLSKAGLEYNDVWDLNPGIAPINFLPNKLKSKFYDSPLFLNKNNKGVESLKEIKIPIDKFIGKPFMSHGVLQNVTSDKVVDNLRNSVLNELDRIPISKAKTLDWYFTNPNRHGKQYSVSEAIKNIEESELVDETIAKHNLKKLKDHPKFQDGGWLEKYNDGGPVQPNYNEYSVSAPEGFEGDGYSNVGRNYSPAWGGQFQDGGNLSFISNPKLRNMLEGYQSGLMQPGDYRLPEGRMAGNTNPSSEVSTSVGGEQGEPGYLIPSFKYGQPLQDPAQEFNMTGQHLGGPFKTWQDAEKFQEIRHQYVEKGQPLPSPIATSNMAMGGSMPGAVGFTYARVAGAAPSNGKYAKKTMASAQNGTEMEYYQNGLDWKPKNISKNGKKVIKDDRGQWDHPGEITEIGSNQITMQGVPYPVMGVSDTGDTQMMYPNQEYQYDGNSVTEYPMMQDGGELTKLDQLTNFTNYNTEQPGGWLEKYQDGGTVGNKWFPKDDLPVDVDVNAQAKTVTKKPAKQAIVPQPAVKSKGLSFEDIPTADDKKVIIDNFSKKYDYIVEGNKTYYRVKGGNTWDDVSDNKTAQKNLLQFIDKNDYWKGYNSGERELLYPNTTSKTAAPKPGVTPTTDETSFFDDLTTNAKGLINNTIVKPLVSSKNIVGKKAKDLQKGTSELVDDVVNSVKSGTNSAIKSTEDLSQTIMNGVTRKIKIFTGIGEDDVEILTEADSKKPKSIKEWYGKGSGTSTVLDTKDQDGRQYKQQVLPISSIKFGVRNREELKDINTEGMEITAFEPFSSNKKLPDNKTVLAIDSGGKLHTGTYKDFKNKPGFKVSETFVNKVMDLPDGKYKSAGPDNPGYQHPMAKVLDDNGKVVDGSINVLVKNDSKKNFYGSIQGGRVLFVDPTTKEQYLVSGSTQHIRDTFKKIKGNNKYLEAYTLDNGTYARGLSYKDGKLTKERLNAYDNENKSGGNGLYIIDNPKPANRYQEDYVENMPNIRTDKDESFKKGHPIKNEIKNIILHHTAYTDPKLNEKQVKDQYMSPGHSSSHVVIEEDGKRTIYASPEQVTFHAGESKWNNRDNVNDFGVGVEFQGDTNRKPLTNAQIESFIEYYKPIANKYGLTAKDIITHQMIAPGRKPDITNKEYNRILKYMKSKNFK